MNVLHQRPLFAQELQDASAEGSKNPFLELTHVELEAEFSLDATTASAEGGFKFLVKVGGETTATQLHRVKLIFSPISADNTVMFEVPSSDPKIGQADSTSETPSTKPRGPIFNIISPFGISSVSHLPKLPNRYVLSQGVSFEQENAINEIVEKAIRKLNLPNKGDKGPNEGAI